MLRPRRGAVLVNAPAPAALHARHLYTGLLLLGLTSAGGNATAVPPPPPSRTLSVPLLHVIHSVPVFSQFGLANPGNLRFVGFTFTTESQQLCRAVLVLVPAQPTQSLSSLPDRVITLPPACANCECCAVLQQKWWKVRVATRPSSQTLVSRQCCSLYPP